MPFHWLRIAAPRKTFWLGCPLLLYVWTLGGPFLSDDMNLILKAEAYQRGERKDLGLYRFAATDKEWQQLRDRGTIPWWSPKKGRLDFLRPISELSFYADVALFGRRPVFFRAMSLLVFALSLFCVRWMFVQAGGDAVRAGVATILFGISQTVAPPVTWMCNRQDLLVVIGVSVAAGAYWAAMRSSKIRFAVLAVSAFMFALLAKEVAVALAGVIGTHELILRWRTRDWKGRACPGVIALTLMAGVVAFAGYYLYSRPWVLDISGKESIPSQLSSGLPLSLLLYSSVWSLGYPIDTLAVTPISVTYAVAIAGGVLLLLTAHYIRRATRNDKAALFFFLWAMLFIIPGLRALTPSTRTLCTATIGWCYLVAAILVPARLEEKVAPLLLRQFLHATNCVASICCCIGTVLVMNQVELTSRHRLEEVVSAMNPPLQDGDALVLLHIDSALEMICAGDRLEFITGKKDVCATCLFPPDVSPKVVRVEKNSVTLRDTDTPLLGSPFHRLTRGPNWRPKLGDTFHLSYMDIEVSKLDDAGEVSELRLTLNEGLGHSRIHFDPPELGAKLRGESVAALAGNP